MIIIRNQQDGFKLDIPYGGWIAFCAGLALLLHALPDFVTAIRWW